ncbi:MAG: HAMP domain-containing sensor histidine kinase [Luteolibacter sp.]
MHVSGPRTTLLLLWALATVVLVGGILLARQTRRVHADRDHTALLEFSSAAQARLQRLEDIYEDHLSEVGGKPLAEMTGSMGNITGILRVSLLHPSASGIPDTHFVPAEAGPGGPPPPSFTPGPGGEVAVDEERVLSRDKGWIDGTGKPLMYYVTRSSGEAAVLTISRGSVAEAITGWLRAWTETSFAPVRTTGGPDQLRTNAEVIAANGTPEVGTSPDLILPLRSRFGSFELVSWDPRITVVTYHGTTLAVAAALAGIIGIFGFVIFLVQRREQAAALQRVSFVNRVSHELRTPLTNILLNIDLADELAEDDPEESGRRLDLVRAEAGRLGRLIENVLTFSRAGESRLEMKIRRCIPAEVVSSVLETFRPGFQRLSLEVRREDENSDHPYLCDADALAQILGNLLSNIEKYVPGGTVLITTRIRSGELVIHVCDEGPGIPPEAAERIFRPFERIHSHVNEGATGTGLGLAIARDLATRLGGTLILLPASPGTGCRFELRLPAPSA